MFYTAIDVTGDKTQAQGGARRSERTRDIREHQARGEGLFTAARTESDEADVARTTKRGGCSRAAVGMIGIVVVTLVVVSALQMDKLPYLSPVSTYSAYFDDAGGLSTGDVVMVSGYRSARSRASLAKTPDGTGQSVVPDEGRRVLGNQSQAAIKNRDRARAAQPDAHPARRRTAAAGRRDPHNLGTAFAAGCARHDRAQAQGHRHRPAQRGSAHLTDMFAETPSQVRAVDGVTRLSKAVNDRCRLRHLLGRADSVSSVVAKRSEQITHLLIDANSPVGEVQTRRAAPPLITGVRDSPAAQRIHLRQQRAAKPVQEKLQRVLTVLTDKEQDLKKTIDRLGPFANCSARPSHRDRTSIRWWESPRSATTRPRS